MCLFSCLEQAVCDVRDQMVDGFFGEGFAILLLFALEIKNDGWMSTEQSFIGVDKIPTYYATFIIFFINKHENLSF